ncbi:hypothetical protein A5733_18405 [Mycobacterium sp. NS-7484]|uniref:hypothetical protein n=1 Tax=Mycobacterium sp. NS-7484 TaxID=1834161 RepID=UPI00096F7FC8|nr:hypothetical protein [Mycobacterium sp. NS-7484]OMC06033.1 hypothetical protein A5733_18405 [Mycobacterium sp. NS-7484]
MIPPGPQGRLVNLDLPPLPSSPPAQPAQVEANVAGWGGSVPLLRRFAQHVPAAPPEWQSVLTALAAWRAGVVRLRVSALAGARDLLAARPDATGHVGAVLAVAPESVGPTLAGLTTDPFWWPGAAGHDGHPRGHPQPRIDAVGGFVGLGGPFLVPPEHVVGTERPDRFVVRAGRRQWLLLLDVCGAVFVPSQSGWAVEREQGVVRADGSYLLGVDVPGLRIWP